MEEEVNYLIDIDDDKCKEIIIDLLNKLFTDSYCQIIFAKKIIFKWFPRSQMYISCKNPYFEILRIFLNSTKRAFI